MNVALRKFEGESVFDMPAEHWKPIEGKAPLITCKNGHMTNLDAWNISADGKVAPSVWCRTTVGPDHDEECGWHVMVRLEGYDHG